MLKKVWRERNSPTLLVKMKVSAVTWKTVEVSKKTKNRITIWSRLLLYLRQQRICLQCRRHGFNPWVGNIPWRRKWQPTLLFLPGKSHGQRTIIPWTIVLVDYGSYGHKRVRYDLVTKQQLYSIGNYIQYSVISHSAKEYEK